jgi:hypothetical protein
MGMVLMALGAALIVGAPLLWLVVRPGDAVGAVADVEGALRATTTTAALGAEPPEVVPSDRAEPPTSPPPVTSAAPQAPTLPPELTNPPDAAPIGLRIGALDVDAPIGPYGVDNRGRMDVPDNVSEVGWYRHGPSPGGPGSAVLAAHVDLARQGPGVFFELDKLEPGEVVFVDYDDGSTQAFEVVARTIYDKKELPLDVIFAKEGPPVLTLVTCGGNFSRSARVYDSNVVVYAVPVELPAGAPA